jgi:hypothetical protein
MRAANPPPVDPAMSPTLGELDGGLVSPSEGPETPVGSDEVPVLVSESSGSGKSSDIELLLEVNKPEVPVILPEDADEAEVELEVPDDFGGAGVVEAEAGSRVVLTGEGFGMVESTLSVARLLHV